MANTEIKKPIWENERVCNVLKKQRLIWSVTGDIQQQKQKDTVSALLGEASASDDEKYEDVDAGVKMQEELKDYEGLVQEGKDWKVEDESGTVQVTQNEYYLHDNKKQDIICSAASSAMRNDMRRYPDPQIDQIRQTNIQLLDTSSKEYCRTLFKNPHLARIESLAAGSIKISKPVSDLKYELGETTFNTLTNVRIHGNKVILNAIETERILDTPPAQRQTPDFKARERKHLNKVWESHRNLLENYDAMSRLDPKQYTGSAGDCWERNMNNGMEELTVKPRGPRTGIGWIRGEKKAIENGWGLDELGLLGMIGMLDAASRVDLKLYDALQQDYTAERAAFLEEFASLKMNVWDKPVRNADDKKIAAQQIRDFITRNKEKNGFTKQIFNGISIEKVNDICQKVNNRAKEKQEDPLDGLNTQDDFNKYFDSQKEKGDVQFLNAITNAYSKNHKAKIEDYMRHLCQNGDEGKKYLLKIAKTLTETLNEQRKNVYERITQISKDYLDHPDKVDKQFRPYLSSEPLRRQLAYNSIQETESVKQMMETSNLLSTMSNCKLPDNYNNNIKDVIKDVQNSKNKYTEYQFDPVDPDITFSVAINKANGQLDLKTLKTEQYIQLELMENYKGKVDTIVEKAKRYFAQLDTTLSGRDQDISNRSGDFIKMYNAVKTVSELNEDSTPAAVEQAINQMADSSNEYIRKNDSFIKFSSDGGKRLLTARKIQGLSQVASMNLFYGLKQNQKTKEFDVPNGLTSLFTDKNKSIKDNINAIKRSYNLLKNPQGQLQEVRNNQPQVQQLGGKIPGEPVVKNPINQTQGVKNPGNQPGQLKPGQQKNLIQEMKNKTETQIRGPQPGGKIPGGPGGKIPSGLGGKKTGGPGDKKTVNQTGHPQVDKKPGNQPQVDKKPGKVNEIREMIEAQLKQQGGQKTGNHPQVGNNAIPGKPVNQTGQPGQLKPGQQKNLIQEMKNKTETQIRGPQPGGKIPGGPGGKIPSGLGGKKTGGPGDKKTVNQTGHPQVDKKPGNQPQVDKKPGKVNEIREMIEAQLKQQEDKKTGNQVKKPVNQVKKPGRSAGRKGP